MANLKRLRRKLKSSSFFNKLEELKGDNSAMAEVLKSFEAEVLPTIEMQTRMLAETLPDFEPRVQYYGREIDERGWQLFGLETGNPLHIVGGYEGLLQNIKARIKSMTEDGARDALALWQFPFRTPLEEDSGACLLIHESGTTLYILLHDTLRCMDTSTEISEGALIALMARFKTIADVQKLTAPRMRERLLHERKDIDGVLTEKGLDPKDLSDELLGATIEGVVSSQHAAGAITGYVRAMTESLLNESHNATIALTELVVAQTRILEKAHEEMARQVEDAKLRVTKGFQGQLDTANMLMKGSQERARRLEKEMADIRKAGMPANVAAPANTKDPVALALGAYFS